MSDLTRVATGASYGALAQDEHARKAVQKALAKMAPCTVGSVLLFLTGAYAFEPQNAIKEAAKAAGTPLVFGCCAMSLLTEEEWLLDVEGAVAMVFPQDMSLQPLAILEQQGVSPELVLTLSSPNAATIAVNSTKVPQVGAITTDEYGHGPFSVWQNGRIVEREFSQAAFPVHMESEVIVSESIKPLSPIMQINRASEHSLYEVGLEPACDNLLSNVLHAEPNDLFGLLCAVSESNDRESIEQGFFKLHHLISVDQDKQVVRLSGSVKAGKFMFWAARDVLTAEQNMQDQLQSAKACINAPPEFALMFPNIGQGPEFFGGVDKDLLAFQQTFPKTPLIGFYGNGEIAPGYQLAGLIRHYSTVVALYASKNQHDIVR